MEDRDDVMISGPHIINNKPIIVKPWVSGFDFSENSAEVGASLG